MKPCGPARAVGIVLPQGEAEEFLRDKLSAGPVEARNGEEHAKAIGIGRARSWASLPRRAA
jgi:hypothetical protein